MKLNFVSSILNNGEPKEGKDIEDSHKYEKCIYLVNKIEI